MRCVIPAALITLLFFLTPTGHAQSKDGKVAFDAPNIPPSAFQFDLDKRILALVIEDSTANPLLKSIDNLYLRGYPRGAVNLKEVVLHYSQTLKARGWRILGIPVRKNDEVRNVRLYVFQVDETLKSIFIIVRSGEHIYLINIVGEIPRKRFAELVLNLDQFGIEIPELMRLKPRDLRIPPLSPSRSPEVPAPAVDVNSERADEGVSPSTQENRESLKSWNWRFDGKQIHDIQLQGANEMESSQILSILRNGSGDIAEVMPVLASVLINSSKKVFLRVEERDAKYVANLTLETLQATRTISVLESLTISGPRGDRIHKATSEKLVPVESDDRASSPGARFWAGDVPIHEIHIRGNRKVSEAEIQQKLGNSSGDIEQALKTLFKTMPYFKEIRLAVHTEDSKYIATLTVSEKPLSTDAYVGLNPPLRLGFNRVTGWEIGTGLALGKRKTLGPLWTWNVRETVSDQTSKLFGNLSYAFGNPHLYYRAGGTANWGKPYLWNFGLTAQVHRLTGIVAPERFPNYNSAFSIFERVFGIPDLQNYYLRQGGEIALRWSPILPTHLFKVAAVAESHANLEKSTDWFVTNWGSNLYVRENPPITAGNMRSLTFQYDFRNRANSLGWHNTVLVEHSDSAVGSDFDFTRLQVHLRYAFRLQSNRVRIRFLFGFSNATLPIQRQFVISGISGLRGYPWRQEGESEGAITYRTGHTASPYTFAGDRGFLLNVEYHYRLFNLFSKNILKNVYAIVFLDEGQVWQVFGPRYTFDPKGNIGIGLQFGTGDDILRVNIAKAFEADKGPQVTTVWYSTF